MSDMDRLTIDEIETRLDALAARPDDSLARDAVRLADDLLAMGEAVLEAWLDARGETPTDETHEGFRLLALHRQGARGNPSFNACRETCRELVYHRNLILAEPGAGDIARRVRLGAMVALHLALFIGGKLKEAGLGDFCCSSRPIRRGETIDTEPETA